MRAEQRTLRAESNARAEAKRQERVLAEAAARLANVDNLSAMSRARTLIEEAKRVGGPAAEAAMRAQIREERRVRKVAEQRERRAREKKLKLASEMTELTTMTTHLQRALMFWALTCVDTLLLKFWDVDPVSKLALAALTALSAVLFLRDAVKI
jgi:hypothetical protein